MQNNVDSQKDTNLEWRYSESLVPYPLALESMEKRVQEISKGNASELIWFLEHPSLYTLGLTAKIEDILEKNLCPYYHTERGGKVTYHGPGQRVVYLMLDLRKRGPDVHAYIHNLEQWLINTLVEFNIKAERRKERIGLWVVDPKNGVENKIAAIGVRLKKWVTMHGIALNVHPDLSYYRGIIPCGIQEHGVTSLQKLGVLVTLQEVDQALRKHFTEVFGV